MTAVFPCADKKRKVEFLAGKLIWIERGCRHAVIVLSFGIPPLVARKFMRCA